MATEKEDKDQPTDEGPWGGGKPTDDAQAGEATAGSALPDDEASAPEGSTDETALGPDGLIEPEPEDTADTVDADAIATAAPVAHDAIEAEREADAPAAIDDDMAEGEKRGGGAGRLWLVVLAIVVVLAGGGYLAWPQIASRAGDWLPAAVVEGVRGSGDATARLDTVEADVSALQARVSETARAIDSLGQMVAGQSSGQTDAALDGLAQRIAGLEDNLAALQQQSNALEQRLTAISTPEASSSSTPSPAETVNQDFAAGLAAAEAKAASAETRADAAQALARAAADDSEALRGQLTTLEQRLAALEQTPSRAPLDQQRAAVLALGQLRSALDAGRPYADALQTVEAVFEGEAALDVLRIRAAEGIPSLDALQTRFPATIEAALHAHPDGGTIWQRTAQRLSDLVTVRRTGEVAGDETDAVLARAELRLTRNDLAGAVSELQALDGPSAAAVAPWLRDATARVEAVRALDSLLDTAVARTAGG